MKQICNLSTFTFLTIYFMFIFVTSCKTEDPNRPKLLPVLTTIAITKITQNTATTGGIITSDGGLEVSIRGVCWSLKPNPTINDSITKDAAGTGEFTSNITNLIADTTYYVRAYATNSDGSAYGLQISFKTLVSILPVLTTTAATDITITSATGGGNITFNGGSAVTARGVCWSISSNPTIALTTKTLNGEGSGIFTSNITNLITGTTYYLRAYATNKAGTSYGIQTSFRTQSIPTLTTTYVTATTATSSNSGGNITSDGGVTVSARGVCWSTTANPTITDNKTSNGTGTGVYTSSITGLTLGTTYYVRSYATNSIGTAYGNQVSLTTQNGKIVLTTTPASTITSTTSTSGGNITSDGGVTVSARGVCWSSTANPTITDNKTSNGTGTGVYTSSITGLSVGTTYYVRSYATNSIGTAYGNQISLTTQNGIIVLTTTPASTITSTTSISGGNITNDGGVSVTERGVCWSTNANPTITDNKTSSGSGKGVFTSNITGLEGSTTYYVRAFATNVVGTVYGNELIFKTLPPTTGTVTDIDGNVYQYITIGTQTWTVENLKTTKYRDGSSIANVTDATSWKSLTTGAWCDYSNLAANGIKYGHLYNRKAIIDSRNIAPVGWHVPTITEWTTLKTYLGGESVAGGKLKQAGTLNWTSPNTGATNETEFSAIPGGIRDNNGLFSNLGTNGYWWIRHDVSTVGATMDNSSSGLYIWSYLDNGNGRGYSVRCLRD